MSVHPEILRRLLAYDPDTGALTWLARPESMFSDAGNGAASNARTWNAQFAGRPAFTAVNDQGYCVGRVFFRMYLAHRVAWAWLYGEWPVSEVDHINGNRADNRKNNMRAVTRTENGQNMRRPSTNTSGVVGVCWNKATGKWLANITVGRRKKRLGEFCDFGAAVSARKAAEIEHGFHPGHGRAA